MYRVGNPLHRPSYCHVLRFKVFDTTHGGILREGDELFYYEDDLMEPPQEMKQEDIHEWVNRGFLVERDDG